MNPTREFFLELLTQSANELAEKQGRDVIFAAPLANLIKQRLRKRLANDELELAGSLYGPVLFPDLSLAEHANLKFRSFLGAFPELVEVFRGPSGDMVRVLNSSHPDRSEELARTYSDLLVAAMRELTQSRDEPTVSAIQLANFLRKLEPEFEPRKIGFASLLDWLESQKGVVEVSDREKGGKVRLLEPRHRNDRSSLASAKVVSGYLLVDSVDLLSALHAVLGAKPAGGLLPDWGQLFRFLKEQYPAGEWKGRYFMALAKGQTESTEGFKGYLEAMGFKVIQLVVETGAVSQDEMLAERTKVNRAALAKMIAAIGGQDAHTFIVSHNASISVPLAKLLKQKSAEASIGVIGFPERMAEGVTQLKGSGLVVLDIERDMKIFKQAIPRRQLISADEFDPTHYL